MIIKKTIQRNCNENIRVCVYEAQCYIYFILTVQHIFKSWTSFYKYIFKHFWNYQKMASNVLELVYMKSNLITKNCKLNSTEVKEKKTIKVYLFLIYTLYFFYLYFLLFCVSNISWLQFHSHWAYFGEKSFVHHYLKCL